MITRQELVNDSEESFRVAFDNLQSNVWTSMPGIIQSINLTKMSCVVQLAIQGTMTDEQGNSQNVNISPLVDCPLVFPSCGDFIITFPLKKGDEVLMHFASRCIDSWWQSGGFSNQPIELRMHDLSDGFATPGPKSIPNVPGSISTTDIEIRNKAGTVYLSLTNGGKIGFQNATGSLKSVLTDFESLLSTFMGVLAAFSGGAAPVTQVMLQVPAATAVTSLASVLTEIGALLK